MSVSHPSDSSSAHLRKPDYSDRTELTSDEYTQSLLPSRPWVQAVKWLTLVAAVAATLLVCAAL